MSRPPTSTPPYATLPRRQHPRLRQTMSEAEREDDGEQSFISHLIELRSRLLKAVAAVLLILLPLIFFANRLYGWLALPLIKHLPQGGTMIATEVASPFLTPLRLAFFVALFTAMPLVLYQL